MQVKSQQVLGGERQVTDFIRSRTGTAADTGSTDLIGWIICGVRSVGAESGITTGFGDGPQTTGVEVAYRPHRGGVRWRA